MPTDETDVPGAVNYSVKNVEPRGATTLYASPEHLRAVQLFLEGADPKHPDYRINGPAADLWSTGVMLYEMLTGKMPFDLAASVPLPPVPEGVPDCYKDQWLEYEAAIMSQQDWVSYSTLASHIQMFACAYHLKAAQLALLCSWAIMADTCGRMVACAHMQSCLQLQSCLQPCDQTEEEHFATLLWHCHPVECLHCWQVLMSQVQVSHLLSTAHFC